jgi:hypothetical protein
MAISSGLDAAWWRRSQVTVPAITLAERRAPRVIRQRDAHRARSSRSLIC